MKWTVSQLQKQAEATFQLDEEVDLSHIKGIESQILDISKMKVTGTAEMDEEKVVFDLRVVGELTLPCARTLQAVRHPFDTEVVETIYFRDQVADESGGILVATEGAIDLLPVLQEIVLLEIPIQVFASEEMAIPSLSGDGWTLISEEANKNKIDPRLAKLTTLLGKKE